MKKRKEEVRGERIWRGWRPASHGRRGQKRKKWEEKGNGNKIKEIKKDKPKENKEKSERRKVFVYANGMELKEKESKRNNMN